MRSYTEIPGFESVALEESYVIDICATPGILRFELELALTPDHPAYAAPPPEESECFRRGQIRFEGVKRLVWKGQGAPPATDATGEADRGHIDNFQWDEKTFSLEGDWGQINLLAAKVYIELEK